MSQNTQNTQNTRRPLKTGSKHSVLDCGTLIHFRWINLKLSLPQHNKYKTRSRKVNWVLTHSRIGVTKLISISSIKGNWVLTHEVCN